MTRKEPNLKNHESGNETPIANHTPPNRERIKHLLIGSRRSVKATINTLHVNGYAETREWSKPQAAGVLGEPGEVISVLIRSFRLE